MCQRGLMPIYLLQFSCMYVFNKSIIFLPMLIRWHKRPLFHSCMSCYTNTHRFYIVLGMRLSEVKVDGDLRPASNTHEVLLCFLCGLEKPFGPFFLSDTPSVVLCVELGVVSVFYVKSAITIKTMTCAKYAGSNDNNAWILYVRCLTKYQQLIY